MVSYSLVLMAIGTGAIVLILIVVDDGLVQTVVSLLTSLLYSLNPYCSGRWSRTTVMTNGEWYSLVLILIVVDDGLVLCIMIAITSVLKVLILIVVDDGLVLVSDYIAALNGDAVLILIVVDDGLVQLADGSKAVTKGS